MPTYILTQQKSLSIPKEMSISGSGILETVRALRTLLSRLESQAVTHPQLAQSLFSHLNQIIKPFIDDQLAIFDTQIQAELDSLRDTTQVSFTAGENTTTFNQAGVSSTTDLTLDIGNDFVLNGTNITDTTAGGLTGNYLKLTINETIYKLQLLAD